MTTPPVLTSKHILKRVAPLSVGKILGLLYAVLGLIFMPFVLLTTLFAPAVHSSRAPMAMFGIGFAIAAPIIYGLIGFVGGTVSAAIYNVAAKWMGGIAVEVE